MTELDDRLKTAFTRVAESQQTLAVDVAELHRVTEVVTNELDARTPSDESLREEIRMRDLQLESREAQIAAKDRELQAALQTVRDLTDQLRRAVPHTPSAEQTEEKKVGKEEVKDWLDDALVQIEGAGKVVRKFLRGL